MKQWLNGVLLIASGFMCCWMLLSRKLADLQAVYDKVVAERANVENAQRTFRPFPGTVFDLENNAVVLVGGQRVPVRFHEVERGDCWVVCGAVPLANSDAVPIDSFSGLARDSSGVDHYLVAIPDLVKLNKALTTKLPR